MASSDVAEALCSREARLYHATGLRPFEHYCGTQSILSRGSLLERTSDCATFHTDQPDRERGLLYRTFGNLADFGAVFWNTGHVPPNVYGAILLVSEKRVWDVSDDICVSTKSAADLSFHCPADCLAPHAVDDLFPEGQSIPYEHLFTEVSLGVPSIPFSKVGFLVVDPIDDNFFQKVLKLATSAGFSERKVLARKSPRGKELLAESTARFQELLEWSRCLKGNLLPSEKLVEAAPEALRDWVCGLSSAPQKALSKWLEYTYKDTLAWP